jgi:ATP dependent DNA ligase domain
LRRECGDGTESSTIFRSSAWAGVRAEACSSLLSGAGVADNKLLKCCTSSSTSLSSRLKELPDVTLIDGELVALDPGGKPSFRLLQNLRSAESHIIHYAFDILFRKGEDLTQLPLSKRREVLESVVKPSDHVCLSQVADKTSVRCFDS